MARISILRTPNPDSRTTRVTDAGHGDHAAVRRRHVGLWRRRESGAGDCSRARNDGRHTAHAPAPRLAERRWRDSGRVSVAPSVDGRRRSSVVGRCVAGPRTPNPESRPNESPARRVAQRSHRQLPRNVHTRLATAAENPQRNQRSAFTCSLGADRPLRLPVNDSRPRNASRAAASDSSSAIVPTVSARLERPARHRPVVPPAARSNRQREDGTAVPAERTPAHVIVGERPRGPTPRPRCGPIQNHALRAKPQRP